MPEYSDLEKAVYGVAAPDVQQLFAKERNRMSARILRVVQSVIDGTALSNQEAIGAWRAGMEAEFPDESWPDDYSEEPTAKSKAIRSILDALRDLGVTQEQRDTLRTALDQLTIPEG